MPNPTNTFLWRYLAQQDAQRAQEGAQAQQLAEQTGRTRDHALAQRKQQFAEDEARGAVLAQLERPVEEVASPSTMRGYDEGTLKMKLTQDAYRRALGMKEMEAGGAAALANAKLKAMQDRDLANRASREGQGNLNRQQSDLNNRRMAAAMRQRAAAGEGRQVNTDQKLLGKDMEQYGQMKTDLNHLLRIAQAPGDISGVGSTGWLPNMFVGDEGIKNRTAAANVLNQIMRDSAGLAQTEQETARQLQANLLSRTASDREWAIGIPKLVNLAKSVMALREAKYSPEVRQQYAAQPGAVTSGTLVEEPEAGVDALDAWLLE